MCVAPSHSIFRCLKAAEAAEKEKKAREEAERKRVSLEDNQE